MNEVKKKRPGRWKPGESGNPAGRRPGSGQVAKLRTAIAEQLPGLLDAMLARALEGDVGAARLLLERTIAPLRAMEPAQPLTLPDGSFTDQGRAVLKAVAEGELAPGQGATLLSAIGALARVAEIDELTARIDALEAAHQQVKGLNHVQ